MRSELLGAIAALTLAGGAPTAVHADTLDESQPGYKGAQVRGTTLSLGFQADRISTDELLELIRRLRGVRCEIAADVQQLPFERQR